MSITTESNLTVAGIVPAQTSIPVHAGWSLISFPSFRSNYSIAELKLETDASRVEAFEPLFSPHYLRVVSDVDLLPAGFGYWIKLKVNTTWTVNS